MEDIEHNMSEICHRDVAARVASFFTTSKGANSYVESVSKKDLDSLLGRRVNQLVANYLWLVFFRYTWIVYSLKNSVIL